MSPFFADVACVTRHTGRHPMTTITVISAGRSAPSLRVGDRVRVCHPGDVAISESLARQLLEIAIERGAVLVSSSLADAIAEARP